MPWRRATFKEQTVWVEVDSAGAPKVDGGRVPIRYQAKDGAKVYRAGASRVEIDNGAPLETLDHGTPADDGSKATKKKKASKGSGFGKAGTRTAEQAAMAADVARKQIAKLEGRAVIAFSDGACRGNPGPAGAGAYVVLPDGRAFEAAQHLGRATNNVAELSAVGLVVDLLEKAKISPKTEVAVFSDSSYTNGVLVKGWKAKANQALIADLKARLSKWKNLQIVWIAGHAGIDGNERADELANRGVEGVTEQGPVR